MGSDRGWIGVDLDGTLAEYGGWVAVDHIGAPIEKMAARVREWLAQGIEVRIFTARVADDPTGLARYYIMRWCHEHFGAPLPVTCQKDYGMVQLWDDRAIQVKENTGVRADGKI